VTGFASFSRHKKSFWRGLLGFFEFFNAQKGEVLRGITLATSEMCQKSDSSAICGVF